MWEPSYRNNDARLWWRRSLGGGAGLRLPCLKQMLHKVFWAQKAARGAGVEVMRAQHYFSERSGTAPAADMMIDQLTSMWRPMVLVRTAY